MVNKNSWFNWQTAILFLIILSTFGPYIIGPIRLEHLAIYAAAPLLMIKPTDLRFSRNNQVFFAFLITLFFWTFISSVFLKHNILSYTNEIENLLQPLVVFLVTSWAIHSVEPDQREKLFYTILKLIVIVFSLHSIVIFYSIITLDITFLSSFHSSVVDERGSVAMRALSNFRFTGVFNQPMEAGFGYSIALFSWYYIRTEFKIITRYVTLFLIICGGIPAVSKIFIFFLIIFAALLLFKTLKQSATEFTVKKGHLYSITGSIFLLIGAYFLAIIFGWGGLERVGRLLAFLTAEDFTQMIMLLTGGRFSTELESSGTILPLFMDIFNDSPLLGYGFAKIPIVDNAFLEMMAYGGIVLLTTYLLFITFLFWKSFYLGKNNISIKLKYTFIFSLILLTSFGAPVFTLNRVSILLVVIITFIFSETEWKTKRQNPES